MLNEVGHRHCVSDFFWSWALSHSRTGETNARQVVVLRKNSSVKALTPMIRLFRLLYCTARLHCYDMVLMDHTW